ncbi:MAG: PepSY domain-containing protein [Methylococcaceae bacterium]|nr:PepSY domain-containing protein [Methylococcaceae bacterium]
MDVEPMSANILSINSRSTQKNQLKKRRKFWLEVHLWLGLTAGMFLVLIGLTGSILVFWQEIDGMLNPQWLNVKSQKNEVFAPPSVLAKSTQTVLPKNPVITWIEFPAHSEQALTLYYDKPSISIAGETDTWTLYIDPYTAKIKGTRLWYPADYFSGMSFMALIFKLHYALLLKDYGVEFVGILAVLLIISTLTGVILWWPLTGKWLKALTWKRKSSKARFNFDLHKLAGFYTCLIMLAVLLSGVYMNLGGYFKTVVEIFSPLTSSKSISPIALQNTVQSISWGEAAQIVNSHYPEGQIKYISPPGDKTGIYEVCKKHVASLNRFVGYRCVHLDQYSGDIIKVIDQTKGSAGDVFLQWLWPLHSGQAFGMTGRLLVLLSGIACAVLYVTGVIRWLQKRKATKLSKAKASRLSTQFSRS